jgi:hypothetical protein
VELPAVVIELPASEQDAAGTKDMIAACNATVRGGCVLAAQSPTSSAATAVVTWEDSEHRRVRIEVGVRGQPDRPAHWLTRTLTLAETDALAERWRAVGLVIATLVDEEERAARAAAPPPPPPPAPPPAAPPSRPPVRRRVGFIDLCMLGEPALDSGSFFAGGALRGAWYPARIPVFVTLAFAYATTPADATGLRVDSVSAVLGAGASYHARGLVLDGALGVRLERIGATIDDPSGASDAAFVVLAGPELGADVGWAPSRSVALVLGLDGWVRPQGVTVQVRGIAVGRALPIGGDARIGLRLSL